jgi:hypothetical protein
MELVSYYSLGDKTCGSTNIVDISNPHSSWSFKSLEKRNSQCNDRSTWSDERLEHNSIMGNTDRLLTA